MKIVTTSWDDGHKLDLKLAILLEKYSIPATFYVSPEDRELQRKDLLNNTQVKALSKNKLFEIGGHTITHPVLTDIPLSQAEKEIKESKKYLEKLVGGKILMFCPPKGLYNQDIKKLIKEAGYLGSRTIQTFRTKSPTDFFEMGTSNHSVYRNIFYSWGLAFFNNPSFLPFLYNNDWVRISCKIFDHVLEHGGIWHFWGHSWQIEKNNWWQGLEEIFKYISGNPKVKYLTNGQTLTLLKKENIA